MKSPVYDSVLITGGYGMLAGAIGRALTKRGLRAEFVDRDKCDLTDPAQIATWFGNIKPTLVINCAAYTNVDKCEQEKDACNAINGTAVGALAEACRENDAMLVHFSTDFVFDGTSKRPYRSDDIPNPLSTYGHSKLLGDQQLQQHAPYRWLLVRTAWLYGIGGASFPRTMLEMANAGKTLRVVNDQVGSPTFTPDLADAVLDLIDHGASGIYHVTNSGQTSWFGLAQAVFEEFELKPDLQPITSADWKAMRPTTATRPAYSVLDVEPFTRLIGRPMRPWRDALRTFAAEVKARGGFA